MAKLTANMVKALESATYSASREGLAYSDADSVHTGWSMYGVNANTLRAMVKRGLCMGDGGLTAMGVSERDAIVDVAASEPLVTVSGDFQEADDAFLHIAQQEAEREADRLARGLCQGLCAVGTGCDHCDEQYGPEFSEGDRVEWDANSATWHGEFRYANGDVSWVKFDSAGMLQDVPTAELRKVEGISAEIETVCVIGATSGNTGVSHYHAADCRDIKREMKLFGQNQTTENSFSSVAEIIGYEFSDVENGHAWNMVQHANSEYSGIKIRSCLSLPMGQLDGLNVTRINGEWFLTDPVECVRCGTHGDGSMAAQETEEGHVCGYCMAQTAPRTHTCLTCGETEQIDGPWDVESVYCENCAAQKKQEMITREYDLSVIVDENTGATVDLGWVTLTIPAMFADSPGHVAAVYGAVHGSGTPRHGWGSIIMVHSL